MKRCDLPQEVACDNSKRAYVHKDLQGNILCHFERQPHPDDRHMEGSSDQCRSSYYGEWIDLTATAGGANGTKYDTNSARMLSAEDNSDTSAKQNGENIELPIIARALEPDEITKFLLRHQGELEIITVNKDHE